MMPRRKSDWRRSRCVRTRDSKEKLLKKRRNKRKNKKDFSLKMNALKKRRSLKNRLDRLPSFESSREKTRKTAKKLPDKSRRSKSLRTSSEVQGPVVPLAGSSQLKRLLLSMETIRN